MEGNFEQIKPVDAGELTEALQHIEHVRAMIGAYGNVDNSEHEFLTNLSQQLESGKITPAEAKKKATGLFESKNLR